MNILAITSMRNEGPHCLEWIAHHRAAGFTHFLIYSNDCDDGTDRMLDALAAAGIVTHVPLMVRGKRSVQWQALKQAGEHAMLAQADWAMVADCDEFLNLRAPLAGVQELIAALPEGTDAVALPWRLFGHSGRIEMEDGLTTEQFVHAAPEGMALPLSHFFKTLFRPGKFRQPGVHRPKRKADAAPSWVNGGGAALPEKFGQADHRINLFGLPNTSQLAQLNHYSLRAAENFMLKRARGLPNHMDRDIGLGYWVERNFNTVEDRSIARMLPATREVLTGLLKIDGIAELHTAALAAHRTGFARMMEKLENVQLFWQLVLSADSTPPPPQVAQAQIRRFMSARGAND